MQKLLNNQQNRQHRREIYKVQFEFSARPRLICLIFAIAKTGRGASDRQYVCGDRGI